MDNREQSNSAVPRVSVIVPVYKSAAYLAACVESILSQSFDDFELLLIDDGSPDECPALCDRYAGRDARIRVIHKENGGVSSARNAGIEQAAGEYVVFIDSDDHVGPEYLSELIDGVRQFDGGGVSLIVTDYQPFSESGQTKRAYPTAFRASLAPGGMTAEQFRALVFGLRLFPPYCKLYRRDVILEHRLRFDAELKSAEDFDFNCRYLEYVDLIWYNPAVQYHYRVDYKKYVPSNRGVLGRSEIKSAHLMARGITGLAQKTGLYEELRDEIDLWAANKHYFNRLRMLFARSASVSFRERRRLYASLVSDPAYYSAARRGAAALPGSTTRLIARRFDCFAVWYLFYQLHPNEIEKN